VSRGHVNVQEKGNAAGDKASIVNKPTTRQRMSKKSTAAEADIIINPTEVNSISPSVLNV
jgi:hypothetical protein